MGQLMLALIQAGLKNEIGPQTKLYSKFPVQVQNIQIWYQPCLTHEALCDNTAGFWLEFDSQFSQLC